MADFFKYFLVVAAGAAAIAAAPAARKFYPDDPLAKEPPPLAVGKLKTDKLSDATDFVHNSLKEPGEKQSKTAPTPSLDVNTLENAAGQPLVYQPSQCEGVNHRS